EGSSAGYNTSTSTSTAYSPRCTHRLRFSRRSPMEVLASVPRNHKPIFLNRFADLIQELAHMGESNGRVLTEQTERVNRRGGLVARDQRRRADTALFACRTGLHPVS